MPTPPGIVELLIYVMPAFAGIIGSRYLSRLANFCVMVAVLQFDLAILIGQVGEAVYRQRPSVDHSASRLRTQSLWADPFCDLSRPGQTRQVCIRFKPILKIGIRNLARQISEEQLGHGFLPRHA